MNRRWSRNPSRRLSTPSFPIVLDFPPRYLAEVPDRALRVTSGRENRHAAADVLDWLAEAGIVARPTLAEVEAERVRRGFRYGVEIAQDAQVAA